MYFCQRLQVKQFLKIWFKNIYIFFYFFAILSVKLATFLYLIVSTDTSLKLITYQAGTENEWKSSQSPKKDFERPAEASRIVTQDHFKKWRESSPEVHTKKIVVVQDFCTSYNQFSHFIYLLHWVTSCCSGTVFLLRPNSTFILTNLYKNP